MKFPAFIAPLVSLLALVCGCGPAITVPELSPAEVPRMDALGGPAAGIYRVEPGDSLDIHYTFHDEMNQKETVRPDGRIRAAQVGEIPVAGLTTREIAAALAARTGGELRDPEVVVTIASYAPRTVYVAGEVDKPGPIPFRRGLTALQAIAQAGGLKETALASTVVLVRPAGTEGRTLSRTLDLDRALHEGAREPLFLAPRDVVFVPRTGVAEADIWVHQHFTKLVPLFNGAGIGSVNVRGNGN
jgi:protein involved in polysaccharide export with SLBB domain